MTKGADPEERKKMIEKMLRDNPDDPFLIYAAALERKKNREIDKALDMLFRLRETHTDYLPAYYQLAVLLINEGSDKKALQVLKEGQILATSQKDRKTLNEINELIEDLEN